MAGEERTEKATSKRRQELRSKGQVTRSPEVLTAFVLAAGLLGLWVGAGTLYDELVVLAQQLFARAGQETVTRDGLMVLFVQVLGTLVRATGVLFLAAMVGGIVGNVVQVGFMVSGEALTPDLNRINPLSGLKNLFQWAKLVDLLKNLAKVAAVSWVAYLSVRQRLPQLPAVALLPPAPLLVYTLDLGFQILKNVLLVYVVIAILDYVFQRWQWENKNKMTKEEVKDEFKQTEGDPLVRSRIRSLQREMARRRMMAEVPEADVVVTNPTHFAVAIRYDAERMTAPEVVAKGLDKVAERILEVARENQVPVYEAPPVARALYRQVEVGEAIPVDLFQAVAEILAQVYRLSGAAQAQRPSPPG